MSIRQLNANYVPEEDRVMLRFTTDTDEEYRLWLTRAVVGALLQQTQALSVKALEQQHSVHQAEAVAQFKQQTLQQTATYTQFEGAARFPLGAEPVLVKAVQAHVREQAPVLVLLLAKGQNLTLRLNEDLVGKLQLLMHRMNDAAHWALGLAPTVQPGLPSVTPSSKPGQDAADDTGDVLATRPKVLH